MSEKTGREFDEASTSQFLGRGDQDLADTAVSAAKGGINKKALGIIAGLALVGGGATIALKHRDSPSASSGGADSLARAQHESANSAGVNSSPFVPPSNIRSVDSAPGMGDDQARMEAMRNRIGQGGANGAAGPGTGANGAPGGQGQQAGGPQGQNQAARPQHTGGGGVPMKPPSILPADLRLRLDPEYKEWLSEQSSPAVAWQRSEMALNAAVPAGNAGQVPGVDPHLQNLTQTGAPIVSTSPTYLPAGTEITCVTDHVVQTDYPSTITATVIYPQEIHGAHVLITYTGVQIERASATPTTLVLNKDGAWKEYKLSGVIRTDLPQLNGDVNHHYARRIVPLVVNAGITGGAVYLASRNANAGISTQDQIWNNMAIAGVQGIQTEIGKVNEGKPDITVTVPAGQEFKILLTQGLDLK